MRSGFVFFVVIPAFMTLFAACRPDGDVLRIMTYNVGVFDKYEDSGIAQTASFIGEMRPDVLILNEVDSCAVRTGSVDQLDLLSEASGYGGFFTPALKSFQGGAYGIAQMWKKSGRMPLKAFGMTLPQGDGSEPRALTVAEYKDMVVAGTHLDHKSVDARMAQARMITDTLTALYGTKGKPVILCGDFNALPDSPTLDYLRESWDVLSPAYATYPDSDSLGRMARLPEKMDEVPGKCIDYIMILKGSAEYETAAAEVCVRSDCGSLFSASDHLPVYVDIRLQ